MLRQILILNIKVKCVNSNESLFRPWVSGGYEAAWARFAKQARKPGSKFCSVQTPEKKHLSRFWLISWRFGWNRTWFQENPDPSSVPSKHLLWHWHLGFAKTILTWDIIIIIIITIESKFRFVQKPAFSSTLMVFAKTIFLTWNTGNQQVRPPEVCVETDCTWRCPPSRKWWWKIFLEG